MTHGTFLVNEEAGLHARTAGMIVNLASRFKSEVVVGCRGEKVSGKSIVGLLSLEIHRGETITIYFHGVDEREALAAFENSDLKLTPVGKDQM